MDLKCRIEVKYSELLYYMFIGSLLFAKGVGFYDGQIVFRVILIFASFCWCGKMVLTSYSVKELILVVLMLMLGGISYKVSGDKGVLLYIMMIIGAKDMSLKKVLYMSMFVWVISFVSIFFLTTLRIVDSPFKVHEKMGNLIIRWGLGYSHPNVLHVSYLVCCMLIGYYIGEKMRIRSLLILMVGNIIIFLYSVSFTGVIAVTFYLILCGCLIFKKKIGTLEMALVKICASFCLLFSMLAPVILKGKLFIIVNNILNTRLNLSKIYLTTYPISLFGKRISEITTYSSTMDNSYVYAYVAYGIIIFALLAIGYALIIYEYCKKEKGKELAIILTCLVSGITEPFLFNTSFKNISLLFLRDLIYKGNLKEVLWKGNKYDQSLIFSSTIACKITKIIKNNIVVWKKYIIIMVGIGVILGMIVYGIFCEMPTRVIVPRSESDVDELYRTELNIDECDIREDDLVYGQPREGTPWMQLTGGTPKIEWFRNIVSIGIFSGGTTFVIVCVTFLICNRRVCVEKLEA